MTNSDIIKMLRNVWEDASKTTYTNLLVREKREVEEAIDMLELRLEEIEVEDEEY